MRRPIIPFTDLHSDRGIEVLTASIGGENLWVSPPTVNNHGADINTHSNTTMLELATVIPISGALGLRRSPRSAASNKIEKEQGLQGSAIEEAVNLQKTQAPLPTITDLTLQQKARGNIAQV